MGKGKATTRMHEAHLVCCCGSTRSRSHSSAALASALALALARSVDRRSMIVYDLLIIGGGGADRRGPFVRRREGLNVKSFHTFLEMFPPGKFALEIGRSRDSPYRDIGICAMSALRCDWFPFDRARRHQGLRGGGSERVDPRPARGGTRAAGRNRSTSTAPSVFTRRRLSCRSLWVLGCFSRSNPRSREAMFHTGSALR